LIDVPSVNGRTIAVISIPIGAITAGGNGIVSILIQPVADSIIRASNNPSWASPDPIINIISTPINIQVPIEVTQPLTTSVDVSFTISLTGTLTSNDVCLASLATSGQWICKDLSVTIATVGNETIASGSTDTLGTLAVVRNNPGATPSDEGTRESEDGSHSNQLTYSLLLIGMALYFTKM
jgi:hypothetical protein